jgi:hypothetical protein
MAMWKFEEMDLLDLVVSHHFNMRRVIPKKFDGLLEDFLVHLPFKLLLFFLFFLVIFLTEFFLNLFLNPATDGIDGGENPLDDRVGE